MKLADVKNMDFSAVKDKVRGKMKELFVVEGKEGEGSGKDLAGHVRPRNGRDRRPRRLRRPRLRRGDPDRLPLRMRDQRAALLPQPLQERKLTGQKQDRGKPRSCLRVRSRGSLPCEAL